MFRTATIAAAAAIAAFSMPIDTAEAGKKGGYHYSQSFITKHKVRGYEGFIGYGKKSVYCSYYRKPIRSCRWTKSGRERCKVVGWRMEQHCD